jgi:hypothetical protein
VEYERLSLLQLTTQSLVSLSRTLLLVFMAKLSFAIMFFQAVPWSMAFHTVMQNSLKSRNCFPIIWELEPLCAVIAGCGG